MDHEHSGTYRYHDDDCMCVMGQRYCNRDGSVWSCCGACKEDSECTAPRTHPTYWDHAKFRQTVSGYEGVRPTFKSDAEIRAIAPELFE